MTESPPHIWKSINWNNDDNTFFFFFCLTEGSAFVPGASPPQRVHLQRQSRQVLPSSILTRRVQTRRDAGCLLIRSSCLHASINHFWKSDHVSRRWKKLIASRGAKANMGGGFTRVWYETTTRNKSFVLSATIKIRVFLYWRKKNWLFLMGSWEFRLWRVN